MKNKKIMIIISVILAVAIAGSGFTIMILNRDAGKHENTETDTNQNNNSNESDNNIRFENGETGTHIDFDDGNEMYFDESIANYLQRLEVGTPKTDENGNFLTDAVGDIIYEGAYEQDFDAVMENLILLINRLVKEEYSLDANYQVQRFYVKYFDRFGGEQFDEFFKKIAECFPREGAARDELPLKIKEVFGFDSGDNFSFVFQPFDTAELRIQFYNVLPVNVEISREWQALSIYDSWHNEEDEEYERNLKSWLENIIKLCKEENLDDNKIILAQTLYCGSLADAKYIQGWEKALLRCLKPETWNYDAFKKLVEFEFGVSADDNIALKEFFKED